MKLTRFPLHLACAVALAGCGAGPDATEEASAAQQNCARTWSLGTLTQEGDFVRGSANIFWPETNDSVWLDLKYPLGSQLPGYTWDSQFGFRTWGLDPISPVAQSGSRKAQLGISRWNPSTIWTLEQQDRSVHKSELGAECSTGNNPSGWYKCTCIATVTRQVMMETWRLTTYPNNPNPIWVKDLYDQPVRSCPASTSGGGFGSSEDAAKNAGKLVAAGNARSMLDTSCPNEATYSLVPGYSNVATKLYTPRSPETVTYPSPPSDCKCEALRFSAPGPTAT